MKLLRLIDCYGRTCYVAESDWTRFAPKSFLVPMRYKTGSRLLDMPRNLRPEVCMIHPDNVTIIHDGPTIETKAERTQREIQETLAAWKAEEQLA